MEGLRRGLTGLKADDGAGRGERNVVLRTSTDLRHNDITYFKSLVQ